MATNGTRRACIALIVLGISHAGLCDVVGPLTMNGLHLDATTWHMSGTTLVVPVTVTNISGEDKEDVRLYITGNSASPWGQLRYVGNGRWEKRSDYTGQTLQAHVGGPEALLPTDQEINIAPGEPADAQYPYVNIGDLDAGESKDTEFRITFVVLSGRGTFYPPYQQWITLATGGTRRPRSNGTPTAYSQTVTTQVGTPVKIQLKATDPEGDALLFTWSSPAHGTVPGSGMFVRDGYICPVVYTPDPGYVGEDSFTFGVSDGRAVSEPATVTITVQGSQPATGLSDDFEDGNYTSNPTWVISNPGYTWATVQPDPVRSGNLALAIHGTDQAHGALDAQVDVPYRGFDVSMEYLATTASAAHPFLAVTNGPVSMIVYYWSESARLSLEEYVDGTEYWHHGAAGSLSANTWYRIHMWHDRSSNLVRAEIRSLVDNVLIGEQSFAPVTNLLTQPPITKVRIAAEETAPQYIDNVTLAPPLPGI